MLTTKTANLISRHFFGATTVDRIERAHAKNEDDVLVLRCLSFDLIEKVQQIAGKLEERYGIQIVISH